MTGNCPEFLESVLAANALGAIAVPLNFRLSGPEAAFVLEDSEATLLVVDALCTPTAGAALAQLSRQPVVLAIGQAGDAPAGSAAYEDALTEAGAPAARLDVPEDAAALIMYTSGTTGRPKGAVLTHHNLRAQCLTGIRAQQLVHEDEANLVTSPLFHIAGVGAVAPSIMNGTTTVIVPTGAFDSGRLLELIEAEGVTSMFLVPVQ